MKAYFVHCGTGCTCCNSEDHYRGPFSSVEKAEEAIALYKSVILLSSQYAPKGRYYTDKKGEEVEELPGGRLIIRDRVFPGFYDDNLMSEAFEW